MSLWSWPCIRFFTDFRGMSRGATGEGSRGLQSTDWSLDILQTETEAIPKELYHSAQGCEARATLGVCTEMNPQPCKGCIPAPTGPFSPPCRNHWPGFWCIPSSPPFRLSSGYC